MPAAASRSSGNIASTNTPNATTPFTLRLKKNFVSRPPKYRRKALYQGLRQELGTVFRSLAEQWECRVEQGHLLPDHVHMLLSVPPCTRCPT